MAISRQELVVDGYIVVRRTRNCGDSIWFGFGACEARLSNGLSTSSSWLPNGSRCPDLDRDDAGAAKQADASSQSELLLIITAVVPDRQLFVHAIR